MCGFTGALDFDAVINRDVANQSLEAIRHRGPDAHNVFYQGEHIFLGHARLSIIDLSAPANQPLFSSRENAAIIYNGEIYNYLQLKEKLAFRNFKTHSDTEIILEGYLEEGVDFFKKLRGIYAFAILDMRSETKVVLARDPSGIKPLYFCKDENLKKLFFASEIKAIRPFCKQNSAVNEMALKQYLNLGYVPEPQTAFRDIKALQPGHLLIWSPGKKSESKPFFRFDFETSNSLNPDRNFEITSEKLKTAISRNLVADVEVSVALSGGIDSSLIHYFGTSEKPSLRSLTVAFDSEKNYDESDLSRTYSKVTGGRHEIIHINEKIDLELINKVFDHFDQPFADSSAIPVYFLNKAASNYGKVLIGGDGGDELFNGYPSQTWLPHFYSWGQHGWIRQGTGLLGRFLPGEYGRKFTRINGLFSNGTGPFEMIYNRNSWFPSSTMFEGKSVFRFDSKAPIGAYSRLFQEEIPESFEKKVVFDYFRKTMLSDYLRKTDMMSMLNSVEWRVPMLDEDLAMHALAIPFNQKSNLSETKKILRKIHRSIYPANSSSAPKSGFSIPLDTYLSAEIKKQIGETVSKKNGIVSEWIDPGYVSFLLNEFNNYKNTGTLSRASVYQRVLILYNLQRWHDKL